jgi:hypothetical protein
VLRLEKRKEMDLRGSFSAERQANIEMEFVLLAKVEVKIKVLKRRQSPLLWLQWKNLD